MRVKKTGGGEREIEREEGGELEMKNVASDIVTHGYGDNFSRPEYAELPAWKYGCMQACFAEMRRAGSYSSMASRRSRPFRSRPGTSFRVSSRFHLGNETLKSGNEVTPGQVFSSGVPRSLNFVRVSLHREK